VNKAMLRESDKSLGCRLPIFDWRGAFFAQQGFFSGITSTRSVRFWRFSDSIYFEKEKTSARHTFPSAKTRFPTLNVASDKMPFAKYST